MLFADEPINVSLIQLIANPKEYDGKFVRVGGFASFEFEGDAIYLHKDDMRYCLTKNGLWLDTGSLGKQKFNGKYVSVEAIFNATSKGHMGLWSGSLQRISRMGLLPDREEKPTQQP